MADADGEQGGAQLRPQHRGDGGETQEGRRLQQRHHVRTILKPVGIMV